MECRRLGRTELELSVIGFGSIRSESPEQLRELLTEGMDLGVNYVDTARGYPKSEERLGAAMTECRNDFHICSRSQSRDYGQMQKDVETSLKELRTDYIDIYQVHELRNEEELSRVIQEDGAAQYLQQAKKDGKIRYTGVSCHHLDAAAKAVATGLFDTLLLPFSPVEYSAKHLQLIRICRELDVGVTAMKPLSGGNFVSRVADTLSLILQHDVTAAITGIGSLDQLRENAEAGANLRILPLEALDSLMAEAAELGQTFCRRCGYCLPCEQEIPIPAIMMSDSYIRANPGAAYMFGGKEGLTAFKKAIERCTACGECVSRCPYDLPIPDLMPGKVAFFEEIWMEHFGG